MRPFFCVHEALRFATKAKGGLKMARTKKVDAGNSGGFKHRTSVGENGEILYDAPVVISSKADMENYGITIEDCSYLHFGGSQKIRVYFFKTSNRAFAEFQWEHISNLHSAGYFSARFLPLASPSRSVQTSSTS